MRHPVRLPRDRPLRDHPAQPHMLAERQPVALHVARRVEERRLILERREREPARAQYRDQREQHEHQPLLLGLHPRTSSTPPSALATAPQPPRPSTRAASRGTPTAGATKTP